MKDFDFLSCAIDVQALQKDITITDVFQNIIDESISKANKIQADKCSKFYNRSVKS